MRIYAKQETALASMSKQCPLLEHDYHLPAIYGHLGRILLFWLAASGSLFAASGEDRDGDGIVDPDQVLVVLRDGVQPAQAEETALAGSPELGKWKTRAAESDFGRMLRRLSGKPGLESITPLSHRKKGDDARMRKPGRRILKLRIDPAKTTLAAALDTLAADPAVQSAEPDFIEHSQTSDPFFLSSGSWGQGYADQWYLQAIEAPAAWNLIPAAAPEVIVAVIDSGVDRTHPDLANVVWNNSLEIAGNGIDDDGNGYADDTNGWNFASANNNTLDTYGHGTLVAGLIAAERGNGFGIAGAASGVRIMALRNGESGSSYASRSIEAIYYAVDQGARVINMSFGGSNYSMAYAEAVSYALDHDVVLVASSGNSGVESYSHYPSGYQGVISVGASDQADQIATFSNYGPAVLLVAPGGGGSAYGGQTMLGCRAAATTLGTAVDSRHVRSSGTSFSSPLVAAAAALLLRKEPTLTPAAIRQILASSADDLETSGWSLKSSYGRLNMRRAMESAVPALAEITGATNGQVVSGLVSVTGTASAPGFTQYVLEYGSGKTPSAWTEIRRSVTAVADGLLGTWSLGSLAGGDYTLRLRVLAAGVPAGERRVSVFVGMQAPVARTGWPKKGLINTETPTVMDLDGDGVREVIIPTSGKVQVYGPDGSAFRAATYSGVLAWPSGPAGVGDIDGDGELEIGTISRSGISSAYPEFHEVCFWNLDGSKCSGWPISLVRPNDFAPHTLAPTLVDVDGDGICEVLFPSVTANKSYPMLHLVRGNGSPMPGWPKTLTSSPGAFIHCTTGAADLDGDGALDFVVADSSGKVHAFNLAGSYLPGWPKTVSSGSHLSQEVALSDLDRDGRTDVIAAFYNGDVAVMNHSGAYKSGWPKNLGSIPRPPAIADLDGDGDLELAIGTQAGVIHVLHHTGVALPGWPKQVTSWVYSPSLVDLNNDGLLDIVASDGNRTLHAWNAAGTQHASLGFPFQLPGSFGCNSAPIVEDLDGDGKLELTVDGDDLEVRNLAAIANPHAIPFVQMHCDPANTCRYVLPGQITKGQKFLVDKTGGTTLHLDGYGLLAGSTVTIGNQLLSSTVSSSEAITILTPSNLQAGWQDIHITHPNSGTTWLANSVLVVDDIHGDTDGDGLPDHWEWSHGFDPLVKTAAGSATGSLGDPDGDGLSNLVEAAFSAMQFDPYKPDIQKLPAIRFLNGKITGDYSRDPKDRMKIGLSWSPDMVHWLKPGDSGFPAEYQDTDLGTGSGGLENRRAEFALPQTNRGYARWIIESMN